MEGGEIEQVLTLGFHLGWSCTEDKFQLQEVIVMPIPGDRTRND